jgi:hypothetical protein
MANKNFMIYQTAVKKAFIKNYSSLSFVFPTDLNKKKSDQK